MAYRFVTGTISHESNTFSNAPTDLEYFEKQGIAFGQDIITRFTGTGTVMGGFIAAAKDLDFTLLPTVSGSATPMGVVTRRAFDYLERHLLDGIRQAGQFDGVLLHLHGAMVVDGIDDAEGRILADVRQLVGPDVPIVIALDLHGNITEEMIQHANALVGYDTYPHVDMFETGYRAAEIMIRTLRDGLWPVTALAKPPMFVPLPLRSATDRSARRRVVQCQAPFRVWSPTGPRRIRGSWETPPNPRPGGTLAIIQRISRRRCVFVFFGKALLAGVRRK